MVPKSRGSGVLVINLATIPAHPWKHLFLSSPESLVVPTARPHPRQGPKTAPEPSDLPRIIQTENKSTAPGILECSPGLFTLFFLASFLIHPLGHRTGDQTCVL